MKNEVAERNAEPCVEIKLSVIVLFILGDMYDLEFMEF